MTWWPAFLLSAVSLPLGALIGLNYDFAVDTRAAMMAFGAGALLFASALVLFGNALHHVPHSGRGPVYMMVIWALIGGARPCLRRGSFSPTARSACILLERRAL